MKFTITCDIITVQGEMKCRNIARLFNTILWTILRQIVSLFFFIKKTTDGSPKSLQVTTELKFQPEWVNKQENKLMK